MLKLSVLAIGWPGQTDVQVCLFQRCNISKKIFIDPFMIAFKFDVYRCSHQYQYIECLIVFFPGTNPFDVKTLKTLTVDGSDVNYYDMTALEDSRYGELCCICSV